MSQAKPIVSKVKTKKTNFWAGVKFFFGSWISNDYCVEARNKPWYYAVLIALLSTFLAILPISINYFNTKGETFFNSPLYGYENSLVDFDETLANKNVHLLVNNNTLSVTGWNDAFKEDGGIYLHKYTTVVNELPTTTTTDGNGSAVTSTGDTPVAIQNQVIDLAIYNLTDVADSSQVASTVQTLLNAADPAGNSTYSINAIFLTETGFYAYKHPTSSTISVAKDVPYKWDSAKIQGKDLALLVSQDITTGTSYNVTYAEDPTAYTDATLSAYKNLFNETRNSTRVSIAWQYTGIFTGVFAGLAMILGLTVFLMTRGKSNPFRVYTFWECQKIAYWASLTPALLAMILSFTLSAYAMVYYIFLYGMRIMWMSMRSLRPQYDESK
jgi:maltodextrin utilization protein YvdJ